MKKKWLLIAAGFFISGTYLWFRLPRMDDRKAKAIANELRSQSLKVGLNTKVKLSSEFSSLAANGSVDVMYQKNGKLAYFLISTNGFKGNYHGYIYVDSGFPFSIAKDYYGRSNIGIYSNDGDDYTTIDRKISDNLYAVFSDLG